MLTDELRELYQEVILDHQRSPRNFRVLPDANHTAEGHNPLCGDQIIVYLNLQDDIVTDIGPRRDKNMAIQVYVGMSIGSTRMEENGCVEIHTWEGS